MLKGALGESLCDEVSARTGLELDAELADVPFDSRLSAPQSKRDLFAVQPVGQCL
jgi:hypothetical protein